MNPGIYTDIKFRCIKYENSVMVDLNGQSKTIKPQCQQLMPVLLVTQEVEIRRIIIQSQPRQIVCEILS
jgi:hypothetical protein